MATLAPFPRFRALDANGDPLAGGKLYTYAAGTTTPKQTFTTQDESAANANPVILDSEGYADVWLESGAYKFVLDNSVDVTLWTVDDVQGDAATAFGATVTAISSNTTVTASDKNTAYWASGTFTVTLPAAATAGGGFQIIFKNVGSGTVTIDPNGSETIDGASTYALGAGESVVVACDGTDWQTYFSAPKASEAQAQAGTSNSVFMTPLRTQQHLAENVQLQYKNLGSSSQTSTSGTWAAITSMTQAITVSKDASKVLIIAQVPVAVQDNGTTGASVGLRITRDGNEIHTVNEAHGHTVTTQFTTGVVTLVYVDAPGTAGAYTYAVEFNRTSGDATVQIGNTDPMSLVVLEINV